MKSYTLIISAVSKEHISGDKTAYPFSESISIDLRRNWTFLLIPYRINTQIRDTSKQQINFIKKKKQLYIY